MRTRLAVAAVLVTVVALAGCGLGSGGERVTIYSGRTENLVGPLLERFADETGIGVDVRYGQSADLALLIDEEGDRSPADVFLSQSPGALGFLVGGGRLGRLPGEVLDLVDARFRSSQGLWVGLSGRVRVLVYNTELVDEGDLPDSVFDLTDSRFRGDVAVAPANASFQDFVTAMRELAGEDRTVEWLRGMAANDSPTYANNTAIVQAVARGEVPMGLVNHYYNHRQLAEDPGSPTANHLFGDGDVGALLITTGVGILDTTDSSEAAVRLVRFLLSEEAQRFFAEETFEYPLAHDVPATSGLPPLDSITTPTSDPNDLVGGLSATIELIEDSGLDS